jgi:uncharacterized protein YndB with AHSA1/START domain
MAPTSTLASRVGSAVLTTPNDLDIVLTRDFAATPERIYEAWTTPAQVRRWWCGPEDEWVTCEIDLRVGGAWRWVFRHHGDDGSTFEVAFHGEYRELDPPHRLVWTEVFEGAPDPSDEGGLLTEMTLTRVGDLTRMVQRSTCPSQEVRDLVLQSGMETGAQALCDRLDELTLP